jgi:integrase
VPKNLSKIVGTLYEDARNLGLVESNPFSNLRLPKTEKTETVVCPSEAEYLALLRSCTVLGGYGPEFRAMLVFTSWMGLRAGEIQGLQWDDIGSESIRVRRARKDDGSLGLPKNGLEREVAFIEPAKALDQVPRRPDPFVFHTSRGEPLRKGNTYYGWNKVRAGVALERVEAGMPSIRFHDLRHLCATRLLERGHSHFDISIHLGHEDGGALVMARYGHPSKDAARDRLRRSFEEGTPRETGLQAVAD